MSMLKKSECIKVLKWPTKALKENPIGNIFNVELLMLNHKLQKQAPHHKMTLPFVTSSNFKLETSFTESTTSHLNTCISMVKVLALFFFCIFKLLPSINLFCLIFSDLFKTYLRLTYILLDFSKFGGPNTIVFRISKYSI